MKVIYIIFISIILFGCASIKKTRTQIITETVIRVDTIIKIKTDTVKLINSVKITDTAFLENTTSIARSYYSTKQQRVVLELKGKIFDVPVTVYKHTLINSNIKQKEVVKESSRYFWILLIILFLFALWKLGNMKHLK